MSEETIDILGYEDFEDRGPVGDFVRNSVDLRQLKNNLQEFVRKIDTLVDELPPFTREYQLDTVEFQVNISASGKVGLLGAVGVGGEMGGAGGVKFVLKKKRSVQNQ
jgi:hypothetical protein